MCNILCKITPFTGISRKNKQQGGEMKTFLLIFMNLREGHVTLQSDEAHSTTHMEEWSSRATLKILSIIGAQWLKWFKLVPLYIPVIFIVNAVKSYAFEGLSACGILNIFNQIIKVGASIYLHMQITYCVH